MRPDEVEKFKRHMAMPREFEIGGDKFMFIPLDCEELPSLMEVQILMETAMNKYPDDREKGMREDVLSKPEVIKKVLDLLQRFVKKSYPDLPPQDISRFVLSNMMDLVAIMNDVSTIETDEDLVQKRIAMIQNATASKP